MTVTSASLSAAISRFIAVLMSVGSANRETLATASASAATVKNARPRRRVRSLMDLRATAEKAIIYSVTTRPSRIVTMP